MRTPLVGSPALLPHIVATGFTAAFLGDERTLREYVVGDHAVDMIRKQGRNGVLYLINDSYDPLNERQLRVAVDKDPDLIERYRPFCGRPIAEVPDPYECHASYSEHYAQALLHRLRDIDIHPVLLDSYQAYQQGHYATFVARTFEHYREIQKELQARFDYTLRNLFRIQCSQCLCIDRVEILEVDAQVSYRCTGCGVAGSHEYRALRGKLSWKLDCAARWNLYGIHTEVFAKAHLARQGTLNSSRYVSETFFGGRLPEVVKYGDLRISRSLSGHLLAMLPPAAIKKLMTDNLGSDLDLTPDYVENFAHAFEVRPGLNFVDYVRKELPRRALETASGEPLRRPLGERRRGADRALLDAANAFSEFYYNTWHGVKWPDASGVAKADGSTVAIASEVLVHTLALRAEPQHERGELETRLKTYLRELPSVPALYPFLRGLFGQDRGPTLTTLLVLVPVECLKLVHHVLEARIRATGVPGPIDHGVDATEKKAA